MTRRAVLLFNPASGRGRAKRDDLGGLRSLLSRHGIECEPEPTRGPGHATALAREAATRPDIDLILAWGGDGTLNEVVRGALGSPHPIGILPGGTVNVFAREIGIPLSMIPAVEVLATGQPRALPVGMAGGRPFLLMAGVGLDAEVVRTLSPRLKRILGTTGFWLHGFRTLARYSFSPLVVDIEGRKLEGTSLIAGNIPRYGTGYAVTPEARLEEPWLDVVLFQGGRARDYLRYLLGVAAGRHLHFADVVHFKTAATFEVHAEGSVYYQLDGEVAGVVPVRIGVKPGAVRFVLPRSGSGGT